MTEWIVTSSAMILIIIALRGLLKGKISLKLQYGLWALVLVRLLLPFSIVESAISISNILSAPVIQEADGAVADYRESYEAIRQDHTQRGEEVTEDDIRLQVQQQLYEWAYSRIEKEYAQSGAAVTVDQIQMEAERQVEVISLTTVITEALPYIWVMGMIAVAACLAGSNLHFWWKLRQNRKALEIPGVPLNTYLTDYVATPCLFGLMKPGIYLTGEVLADTQMRRHVIAHEMSHYRQGDHVWSVLRCVCLALHWYNPLVWIAAVLSKKDAELACDEATIKTLGEAERTAYGRTLIGMTCVRRDPGSLMLTATTMLGTKKTLKDRIALIAKKPKTALYTLIACVLVAAIAVGCTFTGASGNSLEKDRVWEKVRSAVEEYNNRGYYRVTVETDLDFSGHDRDSGMVREFLQHGNNEYTDAKAGMDISHAEKYEYILRYDGMLYFREPDTKWYSVTESDRATDLSIEIPSDENPVLSWTEKEDGIVVVCDYSYGLTTGKSKVDPTATFHIDAEGKLTKYVTHYGVDTENSDDYVHTQTMTIQDPTEETVLLYLGWAYDAVKEDLGLTTEPTEPDGGYEWEPAAHESLTFMEYFLQERSVETVCTWLDWTAADGVSRYHASYSSGFGIAVESLEEPWTVVWKVPNSEQYGDVAIMLCDGVHVYGIRQRTDLIRIDLKTGSAETIFTSDQMMCGFTGDGSCKNIFILDRDWLYFTAKNDRYVNIYRMYLPDLSVEAIVSGIPGDTLPHFLDLKYDPDDQGEITCTYLNPKLQEVLLDEINDPNSSYRDKAIRVGNETLNLNWVWENKEELRLENTYYWYGPFDYLRVLLQDDRDIPSAVVLTCDSATGNAQMEDAWLALPDNASSKPVVYNPDVEKFQQLLRNDYWYWRIAGCVFDDPTEIDMSMMFYTGLEDPAERYDLTEAEKQFLNVTFGDPMRLPAEEMNRVLQEYLGITLSDVVIPREWSYFDETDAYFRSGTDTYGVSILVEDVEFLDDGIVKIYFYSPQPVGSHNRSYFEPHMVLTLQEKPDGGYYVRSNQVLDWEGFDRPTNYLSYEPYYHSFTDQEIRDAEAVALSYLDSIVHAPDELRYFRVDGMEFDSELTEGRNAINIGYEDVDVAKAFEKCMVFAVDYEYSRMDAYGNRLLTKDTAYVVCRRNSDGNGWYVSGFGLHADEIPRRPETDASAADLVTMTDFTLYGRDGEIPVRLPEIFPFSSDAIDVAQEIREMDFNDNTMKVDSYATLEDDVLSVVIRETTFFDVEYFTIYNFNMTTGERMDTPEMVSKVLENVSYVRFLAASHHYALEEARSIFEAQRERWEQYGQLDYYQMLMADMESDMLMLFGYELCYTEDGLCLYYLRTTFSGANNYPTLLPLSDDEPDWEAWTDEEAYAWFFGLEPDDMGAPLYEPVLERLLFADPEGFITNLDLCENKRIDDICVWLATADQFRRNEILRLIEVFVDSYAKSAIQNAVRE